MESTVNNDDIGSLPDASRLAATGANCEAPSVGVLIKDPEREPPFQTGV